MKDSPRTPWTAFIGQATGFNLSLYDQICMHATLVYSGYDDDSIEVCDGVPHFFTGEVIAQSMYLTILAIMKLSNVLILHIVIHGCQVRMFVTKMW